MRPYPDPSDWPRLVLHRPRCSTAPALAQEATTVEVTFLLVNDIYSIDNRSDQGGFAPPGRGGSTPNALPTRT
jgi:hypothetical protein